MGLRCGNNSSTIPSTLSRGSRPDENTASDPARPDAVQVQGQQRGWDSAAVTAAAESHRRSSPSAWLRVTRRLPVIARLDDSSLLSRTGELTASITAADVIVTCAGAAAAGRLPPRPVTPATGLSITISNPGTTSQPAARQDQYLTPRAAPQVPGIAASPGRRARCGPVGIQGQAGRTRAAHRLVPPYGWRARRGLLMARGPGRRLRAGPVATINLDAGRWPAQRPAPIAQRIEQLPPKQ